MKTAANITGYFAAFLLIAAVLFQINFIDGAGVLMTIAGFFLSIYFPVYLLNRMLDTNGGKSLPMHYALAVAVGIINLAVNFKVLHWPGASQMVMIGFGTISS